MGPEPIRSGWRVGRRTMTQSYDTGKQAMAELGAKQPHELLLMLGGVLAILLSVAIYGIQAANQGIPPSQYGTVATTIVINVVLGGALLASAAITRKNLTARPGLRRRTRSSQSCSTEDDRRASRNNGVPAQRLRSPVSREIPQAGSCLGTRCSRPPSDSAGANEARSGLRVRSGP